MSRAALPFRSGDLIRLGRPASVQFAVGQPRLCKLIRVMEPESQQASAGWCWIEVYELDDRLEAVERRKLFVQIDGVRVVISDRRRRGRHPART